MSQENVESFRQAVEDFNRGDMDWVDRSWDAGIVVRTDPIWPGGPFYGIDAARALGISSDGSTLFVTGWSDGGATQNDYATVAYDASTGAGSSVARCVPCATPRREYCRGAPRGPGRADAARSRSRDPRREPRTRPNASYAAGRGFGS